MSHDVTGSHPTSPCGCEPTSAISRRNLLGAAAALSAAAVAAPLRADADSRRGPDGGRRSPLTWYSLVPGFVATVADEWGRPKGTGFAGDNPWGAYTAYRIATTRGGLRTWRIENMALTAPRADGSQYAQGSTMWLFEGARKALLVDTAQNTPETIGVDDLKTVVRHLLSHEDDGVTAREPVDFDVAITHRHGDHTGKVPQMTDRTVYYPDLDWGAAATANWVPVRQDGGSTSNGASGATVSSIDLGTRRIDVVAMYGHTPGSTGYLDAQNLMLATGDAIGSAYVWAHFASATTSSYRDMLRGLQRQLRPLRGLALLPAHFYQIAQFGRGRKPINGKPLDLTYLADMERAASGALDGSLLADPYHEIGRETVWISGGTARMVYSLTNLYPGGPAGGNGDLRRFHGVNIPSRYPADPFLDEPYAFLQNIKTGLVLIRDSADETSFLVRGSRRAVLVTSGRSAPGLLRYAQGIAGRDRVEVVLTDGDPQTLRSGGWAGRHVWTPASGRLPRRAGRTSRLEPGDRLELGRDRAGRRVELQVDALPGFRPDAITLLDRVSRVLLAGDALGTQGTRGLRLEVPRAEYGAALSTWRAATDDRYDTLYTAHNHQWLTRPAYVDSLAAAVTAPEATPSPVVGVRAATAGAGETLAWLYYSS